MLCKGEMVSCQWRAWSPSFPVELEAAAKWPVLEAVSPPRGSDAHQCPHFVLVLKIFLFRNGKKRNKDKLFFFLSLFSLQ